MKYFTIFYLIALFFFPNIFGDRRFDIYLSILIIPVLFLFLKHNRDLLNKILPLILVAVIFLSFSTFSYLLFIKGKTNSSFYSTLIIFQGLFRFFIVLYFFILIFSNNILSFHWVIKFLIIGLFYIILIGVLQYLFPSVNELIVKHYMSSLEFQNTEDLFYENNLRPFSTVSNPATFSLIILIFIAINNNYYSFLSKRQKIISILFVLIAIYIGLVGGSKTFYLGIVIYGIYYLFTRRTLQSAFTVLIFSAILIVSIYYILRVLNIPYVNRLFTNWMAIGPSYAFQTRFGEEGFLLKTIKLLKNSYFIGTGLLKDENAFYGDNLYILLVLRFSFLGMILFIGIVVRWFLKFYKQAKENGDMLLMMVSDSIAIYFFTGMGCASMFSDRGMEFFVILLAIGIVKLYWYKNKENSQFHEDFTYNP